MFLSGEFSRYEDMGKDMLNKQEQLDRQARRALNQRVKSRICYVVQGVGTGNLLRYDGRVFIATCKHVADAFFRVQRGYIILQGNTRIYANKLRYADPHKTDDETDIAILEVIDEHVLPDAYKAYEVDDFELIDDFSAYSFDNTNLMVCGYPSQLKDARKNGVYNMPMSYHTIPYSKKASDEDFLYCAYPMELENIKTSSGSKIKLPRAPGLSGSFVLKVTRYLGEQEKIWTPNLAKVIAMQIAWDFKNYLKCSNIKLMFALLDKL